MGRPTKTNTEINGNEYYRLTRTINGKRKQFYGKSKGEAERKYREYIEEQVGLASQGRQIHDTATFGYRAEEFINDALSVSQKYANSTKYKYELAYTTHIKGSDLDNMIAAEVKAAEVQRFYNRLNVSKQTISTVNKFLKAFCRWLVLNEYSQDFMSAVEIPNKPEHKRHDGIVTWEEDEIASMFQALPGHRLYFFIYTLLYTGARISEAIALTYDDFSDYTVRINKQYYMGELKHPKYNSSREIPMHDELIRAFKVHEEWHRKEMQENGYESDLVFTTSTGNRYDPVNLRRALKRFCNAHGIEYKHPHAFRSTFCTQLCRCGVPLEVASSLMGHKSIEVTAKHYALVKKDTKEDAISMLTYRI